MNKVESSERSDRAALRIHDLIDAHARRTPDAIAVRLRNESMTYSQLISAANALAARLVEAGVGPETLVGLAVSRSFAMIVGVLGILKAGGAFVPLDPAYPADRLAFMIADSAAPVIVSESAVAARLPEHRARVLLIDELDTSGRIPAPDVRVEPQHLAYVVYTSGSTGRPKGVMIEHRAIVSFLRWTNSRFDAEQLSNVLCSSSLSFDVSFFEIFAPLAAGGAICIVRDALELITDPPRTPVRTMSTVSSALAELVRANAIPGSISTVLQAGEYLPASLARAVYETSNVRELINLCGGTEDTIYSVSYRVPRDVPEDPPIGRAFVDRTNYILNKDLEPVAPGTPGEIFYAGSGVARGYHNRPDLTAERFLPNPFGDSPTMYRSGDIVVEGADGEIRYLRRDDQQVKIRGFRVELAEVEAALRDHPSVEQIVVLARDMGSHKTLTAYAVERRGAQALNYDDFQQFAAARLPDYMVPSTLVLVDSMPMGPSGKLDRDALQSLERRRPELAQNYVAPRGEIEARIAALCAEILGLDRVGIYDNFFALGGQSLLAARMIADVEAAFPAQIAQLEETYGNNALLATFYVEPTVESLASALTAEEADGGGAPSAAAAGAAGPMRCIQPGKPEVTPFFLLHGVLHGEAFYAWNLAQGFGSDLPFYAITPHGYDGTHVPDTIEEMASDYLKLIRAVQPKGPYRIAGYCNGGLVGLEIARSLREQGEEVDGLAIISASARNTRFTALHDAVERLGALARMSPSARRTLFLRLRGRLVLMSDVHDWRKHPLRALLSLGTRTTEKRQEVLAPELTVRTFSDQNRRRYLAYLRAIDAYIPRPYKGPIRLLWGHDDIFSAPGDLYNGWRSVSESVDLRRIAGGHLFLEDHPERVVEHLIDIAKPPGGGSSATSATSR